MLDKSLSYSYSTTKHRPASKCKLTPSQQLDKYLASSPFPPSTKNSSGVVLNPKPFSNHNPPPRSHIHYDTATSHDADDDDMHTPMQYKYKSFEQQQQEEEDQSHSDSYNNMYSKPWKYDTYTTNAHSNINSRTSAGTTTTSTRSSKVTIMHRNRSSVINSHSDGRNEMNIAPERVALSLFEEKTAALRHKLQSTLNAASQHHGCIENSQQHDATSEVARDFIVEHQGVAAHPPARKATASLKMTMLHSKKTTSPAIEVVCNSTGGVAELISEVSTLRKKVAASLESLQGHAS